MKFIFTILVPYMLIVIAALLLLERGWYFMSHWKDFQAYKQQAIRAAKELYYGQNTVNRVKEAKSASEIERIMNRARHKFLKDNWERG